MRKFHLGTTCTGWFVGAFLGALLLPGQALATNERLVRPSIIATSRGLIPLDLS